MCLDFDGHHSGGSSIHFYIIFLLCYKMWAIPIGTRSEKKKNQVKSPSPESRVPETGSDLPIGSNRELGPDNSGDDFSFQLYAPPQEAI